MSYLFGLYLFCLCTVLVLGVGALALLLGVTRLSRDGTRQGNLRAGLLLLLGAPAVSCAYIALCTFTPYLTLFGLTS